MRDHLFQLLAPKYFGKWQQRHQLRYAFDGAGATCVQHLPGPRAWLLPPADGGAWLCAQPEA